MTGHATESGRAARFSIADLDYDLPENLIAQRPPPRREDARLLVVGAPAGGVRDARIVELPELLEPGDLLVLNDTKVVPAKFLAVRGTGGAVPGLFLSEETPGQWRVMLQGSRRLRVGETLHVAADVDDSIELYLAESFGEGVWLAHINSPGSPEQILSRIGRTPLPPYIRRDAAPNELSEGARTCKGYQSPERERPVGEAGAGARGSEQPGAFAADTREISDRQRYQTVYATRPGAIAAPTAGLHFTPALLDTIRAHGIETTTVTLHVGAGTFKPISADHMSDHVMHSERYELPPESAEAIRECRRRNGRVVAVGTTSVRVLESAAVEPARRREVRAQQGTTELFIYPPYSFRVVDMMLTNFHLPRTTLLALVMAMAGVETTRHAYRHAIEQAYRFYSFGDAMLITSRGL